MSGKESLGGSSQREEVPRGLVNRARGKKGSRDCKQRKEEANRDSAIDLVVFDLLCVPKSLNENILSLSHFKFSRGVITHTLSLL